MKWFGYLVFALLIATAWACKEEETAYQTGTLTKAIPTIPTWIVVRCIVVGTEILPMMSLKCSQNSRNFSNYLRQTFNTKEK